MAMARALRALPRVAAGASRGFASKKDEFHAKQDNREVKEMAVISREMFEDVQLKNAKTFKNAIDLFANRDARRRGAVEFILAALKHMKEFEVHQNLEVYKALIDVMPKEKYVPENIVQVTFVHYPKQQDCILEVLCEMNINKVIPDEETGELLRSVFGMHSQPYKKYLRMRYWMQKLKNLSPYPLPEIMPRDPRVLGEMAVSRIASIDPLSEVTVYDAGKELAELAADKTWIASGQSPEQREMMSRLPKDKPLYVEGGFRLWMRGVQVTYFILRGEAAQRDWLGPNRDVDSDDVSNFKLWMYGEKDPKHDDLPPEPNLHEQEDGTVLAVAATGTSSKDSLLSWIHILQRDNPGMENIPVLFTLRSPDAPLVPLTEDELSRVPGNPL